MDNFQGDLTNISAKKEALRFPASSSVSSSCETCWRNVDHIMDTEQTRNSDEHTDSQFFVYANLRVLS